jgi:hypothetical protein
MIRKSVAIAFLVAAATAGIPMAAAAPEPTSRA